MFGHSLGNSDLSNLPIMKLLFFTRSSFRYSYRRVILIVSYFFFCCRIPLPFDGFISTAAADEAIAVKQAFTDFQAAMTEHDVDGTLELLSSETKDYYEMLATIVKQGTETELQKLSPMNRMMVETVKAKLPESVWKNEAPSDLLKIAIRKGLGTQELSSNLQLGAMTFKEDQALADLTRNGKVLAIKIGFTKEDKRWKVNLVSLFEQTNSVVEAAISKLGLTNDQWIKLFEKGAFKNAALSTGDR